MPELPEVESVRRGLADVLTGRYFSALRQLHPRALNPKSQGPLEAMVGARILGVHRRGKFLWLSTSRDLFLVAHLGMSGQFRAYSVERSQLNHSLSDSPHLRVRMLLSRRTSVRSDLELHFNDQRTFGWLALSEVCADHPELPALVSHIARDPFDPEFNLEATIGDFAKRKSEIKRLLLDQSLVSGIGNIYADEALWRAKIHPQRTIDSLAPRDLRKVLRSAHQVMSEALEVGGTSFDALYTNVNGESGYFSRELDVYGREGEECRRCGTLIQRLTFMNRSSHICPRCQQT